MSFDTFPTPLAPYELSDNDRLDIHLEWIPDSLRPVFYMEPGVLQCGRKTTIGFEDGSILASGNITEILMILDERPRAQAFEELTAKGYTISTINP